VWVANPKPDKFALAAAHVAGADGFLKCGGAHAIAALAQGLGPVPACNIIVGPGNQWVTAAKSVVQGKCAIDMLAGPSEVLVIADDSADAATVAADMLAQAEHDVEARPILICTHAPLIKAVDAEVKKQLDALPSPNCETARAAVKKGFAVLVDDMEAAIKVSDSIAPEHLEIMTKDAMEVGMKCNHYGGLFIGRCDCPPPWISCAMSACACAYACCVCSLCARAVCVCARARARDSVRVYVRVCARVYECVHVHVCVPSTLQVRGGGVGRLWMWTKPRAPYGWHCQVHRRPE
jgi:hypothetical protein